jgi:hypothetical protein
MKRREMLLTTTAGLVAAVTARPAWETIPGMTPPDCHLLLMRNVHTQGLHSFREIPGLMLKGVPRDVANMVAVTMNRRLLSERVRPLRWNVLTRTAHGFGVVDLQVSENWKPESEYDVPPETDPELMPNLPAIQKCKRFNRAAMAEGRREWLLMVKPLDRC